MNREQPGGHVFQQTGFIFVHIQNINLTNILARKNAPPPGGHVFQPTGKKIKLVQNIIGIILVTKFHEDQTINAASRVKNAPLPDIIWTNLLTKFHLYDQINVASRVKNAPPPGCHVFQPTQTIFKLVQDIIKMNLLTKFHKDLTINMASRVLTRKNAPPPGGHKNAPPLSGHVFQYIGTIFKLIQDIIGTNRLTKFHVDRTINVASRVLARYMYYEEKNW
ncbi:hypothetical protein DPMN_121115 [Dreissena polymorpha]|uniref:Uncharacterized protein n=1 Tax=Dreissena polymorpha TaxID=45954 RepID=A0A9D4JTA7_DREPO|nr:hypothetical protein DPMN_121115 [Dreissena polymorpha]